MIWFNFKGVAMDGSGLGQPGAYTNGLSLLWPLRWLNAFKLISIVVLLSNVILDTSDRWIATVHLKHIPGNQK